LPLLTTAQRDGRATNPGWVDGDMIYNTTTDRLEVRIGGVWKYVGWK